MTYGIFDSDGVHHYDSIMPKSFPTVAGAQEYINKHAPTYVVKVDYHVEELPIRLHTSTLDGKQIAYSDATEFLVQVGRGNSSYRTRYRFEGELGQAVGYYKAINIGHGYKKRLLMPSCSRNPVLARQFSA